MEAGAQPEKYFEGDKVDGGAIFAQVGGTNLPPNLCFSSNFGHFIFLMSKNDKTIILMRGVGRHHGLKTGLDKPEGGTGPPGPDKC